jgi:hypothetical protein
MVALRVEFALDGGYQFLSDDTNGNNTFFAYARLAF